VAGIALTNKALNRALLARQGLLTPLDGALERVVESIGAIQAQYWPAPPVALWTRTRDLQRDDFFAAMSDGRLLMATLLRGTIHVVSAAEFPAYAAVADAYGGDDWRRKAGPDEQPSAAQRELVAALLAFAAGTARTADEISAFVEDWVDTHPRTVSAAEAEHQRTYKWRPIRSWSGMLRAPEDGSFGERAPAAYRTAPHWAGGDGLPDLDHATDAIVRAHLRAFGPAGPEDVAQWIKWTVPPVRASFRRLESELERFEDEAGRVLYDLPDAPRPDPETAAPVRLLPWFDSALLAYAPGKRQRIIPDEHRSAVYLRANLQVKPTFLVDGTVAGSWALERKRKLATITLSPLRTLAAADRKKLMAEAERLVRFCQPGAAGHQVTVG
jgi:Winged helix DNA-binding domain